MIAYFIRRIVGGVVTLVLAMFMIYSLLWYTPTKRVVECLHRTNCPDVVQLTNVYAEIEKMVGLDKPWPLSYLAWLFNPEGYVARDITFGDGPYDHTLPRGINVTILGLPLNGAGVLTGDLGRSLALDMGAPVTDMFGRGLGELMAFGVATMLLVMAPVYVQRRGRPQPHRPTPMASALALTERHLRQADMLHVRPPRLWS